MNTEARKRIRHVVLARHATSPRLRGKYQRSIHAARLSDEAHAMPLPPMPLPPVANEGTNAFPRTGNVPGTPALPQEFVRPHSAPAMMDALRARTRVNQLPLHTRPARRTAIWAIALAMLPILILGRIGVGALSITGHTQDAIHRIYVSPPSGITDSSGFMPDSVGLSTNTPNDQGAIVPRSTVAQPVATVPPFTRNTPFTMLLLGVEDQRNGENDYSRSDTLILAYIDPAAKRVSLLSIPRDLFVPQADGHGPAKFADIFANGDSEKYKGSGGIALVQDTVSQYFDITIDYFVRVNFQGLQKIVDAVGGVTVDSPYSVKDDAYPTEDFQYTRVYFPAGLMHLNGAEALQYARTRHGDNDYQRNARQQQIILAVREQAVKANLFAQAPSIIDAVADSVRTSFPPDQWLPFASFAKDLKANTIEQYNLTDLLTEHNDPTIFYSTIDQKQAIERVHKFAPTGSRTPPTATPKPATPVPTATPVPIAKARVVVENGTTTGGLAQRWSQALVGQGVAIAGDGYVDAPPAIKGQTARSTILVFGPDDTTAKTLAKTLGLAPSVVTLNASRFAPLIAPDLPMGTDILIVLGDDAREP